MRGILTEMKAGWSTSPFPFVHPNTVFHLGMEKHEGIHGRATLPNMPLMYLLLKFSIRKSIIPIMVLRLGDGQGSKK